MPKNFEMQNMLQICKIIFFSFTDNFFVFLLFTFDIDLLSSMLRSQRMS